MSEQDILVELKVLKERQKIFDSRLKDVDECCGKLKGTINAEMRVVNERIVSIESGIISNCQDVELQMKALEEQTKTQFRELDEVKRDDRELGDKLDKLDAKLDKKMSKLTSYYVTFTLGILSSLVLSMVALIR